MNRVAMLVALVAALIGGGLSFLYLKSAELRLAGGAKVVLLSLVKDVPAGAALTEDMLAEREVPMAYVEDRSVKSAEEARVLGLKLGNRLRAGQTLLWSDLAISSAERRELSGLVQPGRRAYKLHSGHESFRMVEPGDHVDLLGSVAGRAPGETLSVVLLQKVLVLAVGGRTRRDEIQSKGVGTADGSLTLSVTLEEAQLLSLTTTRTGTALSVVLRSPGDDLVVPRLNDVSSNALRDLEERAKIKGRTTQKVEQGPVELKPQ
jgi:pilus assembly protein CpaB